MKIAYADPPYIGQAKKHYGCAEIDHAELVARLCANYDAWALSLSSPSLHLILPMCPTDTRIAAWVKPFAIFKPGVNPGYTWEPVLFRGVRKRPRSAPTVRDFISCNITLKRGLVGAKPKVFCEWLFDLLAVDIKEDEFFDLYPGSGAVTLAFEEWRKQKAAEAVDTAHNNARQVRSALPNSEAELLPC